MNELVKTAFIYSIALFVLIIITTVLIRTITVPTLKKYESPAPFTQEALETYPAEKKSKTDEITALIKEARLDYCKRADGYTYKYPDVCLIDNELKYIEIQTGGILQTGQILNIPHQEAITYLRGRIYTEDVPSIGGWIDDEINARKEYEIFKSNSKKPLEYPLESENFEITHSLTVDNGVTTLERFTLWDKRRQTLFSDFVFYKESDLKELYQLLKSKYE